MPTAKLMALSVALVATSLVVAIDEPATRPTTTRAATQPATQPAEATEADYRKERNGFGGVLFLTADTKFFEDWEKPDPPRLTRAKRAHRGETLHTVLLFVGAAAGADGVGNVTYDFKVLQPDGGVYGESKDAIAWSGTPLKKPLMMLAESRPAFGIEPDDPLGRYTLLISLHDKVAGTTLELRQTFDVVADE